jgi:hypothetical protein
MNMNYQIHPLGKSPTYPLYKGLGESQNWDRRFEEKNLAPAENRTPVVQPVTIPTEIPRLLNYVNRHKVTRTQTGLQNRREGMFLTKVPLLGQ